MTKTTKTQKYAAIINVLNGGDAFYVDGDKEVAISRDALIELCNAEIASIIKKNEKSRERRAADTELVQAVQEALTDEYQSIADIAASITGEDVTIAKVQYRLNALYKDGVIDKGEIVIPATTTSKRRTIVGYRLNS